jgi:cobalt/nickel transport system permease protein
MHISEGVIAAPLLLAGAGITATCTVIGLKKLDYDRMAKVGILASVFFVASLITVPIGPSSAHLMLNGIVGLLLGWAAFPAILVGLILQAMFFQYGGITVLGVNTLNIAGPAVLCSLIFNGMIRRHPKLTPVFAFLCGSLAVLLAALMMALSLIFTEEGFTEIALVVVAANFPVIIIEGIITASCIAFLRKVQPESIPAFASRDQCSSTSPRSSKAASG